MMAKYLAIDGGTTNTRLYYLQDHEILKMIKLSIGVRVNIDEPGKLQHEIRNAIQTLFEEFGPADHILASGMITSDLGLFTLPHLPIPAGVHELNRGIKTVLLPEITNVPFCFIPGLRQNSNDFTQCDMMRGEECEIMGLMRPDDGLCAYVLPGSHSKLIFVDENEKIVSFSTMLTGEMIAALSSGTILKSSVDLSQPIDEEYLVRGCRAAEELGLNSALFKTRILDTVFHESPSRIYSYFLGVVLSEEIRVLKQAKVETILLAGQQQLAEATAVILKNVSDKKIVLADEERSGRANVEGMLRVFEEGK